MPFCIKFFMLTKLLGTNIVDSIKSKIPLSTLTEVRIRANRRITIKNLNTSFLIDDSLSEEGIQNLLRMATNNSLYAVEDDIKKGFVSFAGIRIGICGKGVTNDDKLITIRNITSLTIRIPHEIINCSKYLHTILNPLENILIISPPCCGKTTLIRDVARVLSNNYDTLIVDERGEIYSDRFTFGERIDVFTNTPKNMVVEGVIRALSPEVIVLDEVYGEKDIRVLEEIERSGVKIVATTHSNNLESLKKHNSRILNHFNFAVELSNKPKIGTIKSIVRLR